MAAAVAPALRDWYNCGGTAGRMGDIGVRASIDGLVAAWAIATMRRGASRAALVVWVGLLGVGCAQTSTLKVAGDFTPRGDPPRVLLMPTYIELAELSAAGIPFPKADWTEAANVHVTAALDGFLRERGAALVVYATPPEGSASARRHNQLIKLHGEVGNAVLVHKFVPQAALPTTKDKFDWTLGGGVAVLGAAYDADYALFVFIRDSYSSAERVVVMVVGALLGVGVPGGVQFGFASLVDLESGGIVWFNRLVSGSGDLRTPEPARQAVDNLLADFPL